MNGLRQKQKADAEPLKCCKGASVGYHREARRSAAAQVDLVRAARHTPPPSIIHRAIK